MYIYKEEELEKKVKLLNALINQYSPWQETVARKEHEDLFGVAIKKDEMYFKRTLGGTYDDVIKMSRQSMDKFVYCLFNANASLEALAEKLETIRMEDLRKAIDRLEF